MFKNITIIILVTILSSCSYLSIVGKKSLDTSNQNLVKKVWVSTDILGADKDGKKTGYYSVGLGSVFENMEEHLAPLFKIWASELLSSKFEIVTDTDKDLADATLVLSLPYHSLNVKPYTITKKEVQVLMSGYLIKGNGTKVTEMINKSTPKLAVRPLFENNKDAFLWFDRYAQTAIVDCNFDINKSNASELVKQSFETAAKTAVQSALSDLLK